MTDIRAILLNCTLKSSGQPSSTDRLLGELAEQLRSHDVDIDGPVRVADHDIRPGVTSDEGDGDDWPALRRRILDAEILVIGTPIWLGHPTSFAQRVLERLDAFLGETDDEGRIISYGCVALVAVVGNEDGAHYVSAQLYQALNDVGFTIPASGVTYWVGQAMQGIDYKDLPETPKEVAAATAMAARNAAHLARALDKNPYPAE